MFELDEIAFSLEETAMLELDVAVFSLECVCSLEKAGSLM